MVRHIFSLEFETFIFLLTNGVGASVVGCGVVGATVGSDVGLVVIGRCDGEALGFGVGSLVIGAT